MERNLSMRDVLTSVFEKVKMKNDLSEEFKKPFFEFNEKFNVDNCGKKVNLTFFGSLSAGKTNLVNIIIRDIVTSRTKRDYKFKPQQNQKTLQQDDLNEDILEEEDEDEYDGFLTLITKDAENTYFITLIENSETENYQIILKVFDEDHRQQLEKLTISVQNKYFDGNNPLTLTFKNNEEGITKMNKFLKEIDNCNQKSFKKLRMKDLSTNEQEPNTFNPPIMIIKIPYFPKEYRLIDSQDFQYLVLEMR